MGETWLCFDGQALCDCRHRGSGTVIRITACVIGRRRFDAGDELPDYDGRVYHRCVLINQGLNFGLRWTKTACINRRPSGDVDRVAIGKSFVEYKSAGDVDRNGFWIRCGRDSKGNAAPEIEACAFTKDRDRVGPGQTLTVNGKDRYSCVRKGNTWEMQVQRSIPKQVAHRVSSGCGYAQKEYDVGDSFLCQDSAAVCQCTGNNRHEPTLCTVGENMFYDPGVELVDLRVKAVLRCTITKTGKRYNHGWKPVACLILHKWGEIERVPVGSSAVEYLSIKTINRRGFWKRCDVDGYTMRFNSEACAAGPEQRRISPGSSAIIDGREHTCRRNSQGGLTF